MKDGFLTQFIDKSNQAIVANQLAIALALIEKGVLTEEDITSRLPEMLKAVREAWEEKRREK